MNRAIACALLVVGLSATALGEQPASSTPMTDVPAVSEPPPPPGEAPSTPLPPAFFERMLSVDEKGRVYEGRARRLLSREEVFARLERPDLLEESEELSRRRVALAISAGLVAVTGTAVGIALIVLAPPINTVECEADVHTYNEVCVPRHRAYQLAGGVVLGSTFVVATLLATLAWWTKPDVLSRDELTREIATYNAKLKKRLAPPVSWRVTPYLGPGGGGLVVRLGF